MYSYISYVLQKCHTKFTCITITKHDTAALLKVHAPSLQFILNPAVSGILKPRFSLLPFPCIQIWICLATRSVFSVHLPDFDPAAFFLRLLSKSIVSTFAFSQKYANARKAKITISHGCNGKLEQEMVVEDSSNSSIVSPPPPYPGKDVETTI